MLASEIVEIYLHPGEWELVDAPAVIKTVLGSCVGITFRVHRLGIGAMCHPMLPNFVERLNQRGATAQRGRYVDSVIRDIAQKLEKAGALPSDVEVKVFGGDDVLASARERATVGAMNVETALNTLEAEGFRVAASHVGGSCGVFIEVRTWSGEVLLRRLDHFDAGTMSQT